MTPENHPVQGGPSGDPQQDSTPETAQAQPPAVDDAGLDSFLAPPPVLDFGIPTGVQLSVPPSLGKAVPTPEAQPWLPQAPLAPTVGPAPAAPAAPAPAAGPAPISDPRVPAPPAAVPAPPAVAGPPDGGTPAPARTAAAAPREAPPRLAVRPKAEPLEGRDSWGPPTAPAKEPRRPRPAVLKTRRRADWRVLALGTITAVAVSVITVSVLSRTTGSGHASSAPTPASASASPTVTFSRTVPPGWSQHASWSAPISPGTHPALSDGLVALVSADRHLQLRYGSTGAIVWSTPAPLPPEATGSPAISVVGGASTVLIQGAGEILTWQVSGDGTKATPMAAPDRAQISTAGESPLVSLPDHTSAVLGATGLTKVAVPDRTTAMAADKDAVIAGDPKGVWWRIPPSGGTALKVTPAVPAGADQVTRIAAAGHGVVALVWSMKKNGGQQSIASLHDAVTGKVLSQASAPTDELRTPVWLHSAEGQVAALGPVLFDLANETATAHPGFAPLAATGKVIYGQLKQHLAAVRAGPNENPTQLADGTALPWGITAGGRAVVADRTTAGISLFALMPTQ